VAFTCMCCCQCVCCTLVQVSHGARLGQLRASLQPQRVLMVAALAAVSGDGEAAISSKNGQWCTITTIGASVRVKGSY
jgi:hypothetical protein